MFVRDRKWALDIVEAMARERGLKAIDVLSEFSRYERNGQCQHFWPDQNTACQMILALEETASPYATVNS